MKVNPPSLPPSLLTLRNLCWSRRLHPDLLTSPPVLWICSIVPEAGRLFLIRNIGLYVMLRTRRRKGRLDVSTPDEQTAWHDCDIYLIVISISIRLLSWLAFSSCSLTWCLSASRLWSFQPDVMSSYIKIIWGISKLQYQDWTFDPLNLFFILSFFFLLNWN